MVSHIVVSASRKRSGKTSNLKFPSTYHWLPLTSLTGNRTEAKIAKTKTVSANVIGLMQV